MNRLPLPQPDPTRDERLTTARVAVDALAEALRRVDPDLWPDMIGALLVQLAPGDDVLERVQRLVDDRLAWGDWPTKWAENDE